MTSFRRQQGLNPFHRPFSESRDASFLKRFGTMTRVSRPRRVRRITLADEGRDDDVRRLSPGERVAMMWQLALQAWMFKEGLVDEPRLRRDVVRVVRGRR